MYLPHAPNYPLTKRSVKVLFLCLAFLFISFSGVVSPVSAFQEDTSYTPISAETINALIDNNQPVDINHQRITCDPTDRKSILYLGQPPFIYVDSKEVNIAVNTPIKILDSIIECQVILSHTDYSNTVDFTKTEFQKDVSVGDVTFGNLVNFNASIFDVGFLFVFTIFKSPVDFSGIHVRGNSAFLNPMVFEDDTNFTGATFSPAPEISDSQKGSLGFIGVNFKKSVTFQTATFGVETIFSGNVDFEKETNFSFAQFNDNIQFNNVEFHEPVSFRRSHFASSFKLSGKFTTLNLTAITMDHNASLELFRGTYKQLIDPTFNVEWIAKSADDFGSDDIIPAFAQLETNFRNQGQQALANEVYYLKREAECSIDNAPSLAKLDCFLEGLVGYLVQPFSILWFAIIVIGVFGILFYVFKVRRLESSTETVEIKVPYVQATPADPRENNLFIVASRPKSMMQHDEIGETRWQKLGEAVGLSFVAFVSLRLIKVDSKRKSDFLKSIIVPLLVNLEWLLGLYALISLAATLTNTIPVLGQLLKQLHP